MIDHLQVAAARALRCNATLSPVTAGSRTEGAQNLQPLAAQSECCAVTGARGQGEVAGTSGVEQRESRIVGGAKPLDGDPARAFAADGHREWRRAGALILRRHAVDLFVGKC